MVRSLLLGKSHRDVYSDASPHAPTHASKAPAERTHIHLSIYLSIYYLCDVAQQHARTPSGGEGRDSSALPRRTAVLAGGTYLPALLLWSTTTPSSREREKDFALASSHLALFLPRRTYHISCIQINPLKMLPYDRKYKKHFHMHITTKTVLIFPFMRGKCKDGNIGTVLSRNFWVYVVYIYGHRRGTSIKYSAVLLYVRRII